MFWKYQHIVYICNEKCQKCGVYVNFNKKLMIERIKNQRKKLGYTQRDIANKIGISLSQYNYFENGKRNISFKRFERLIGELGLMIILSEYDINEEELINIGKLLKK